MQWTQMNSWSELRQQGDWILERRHSAPHGTILPDSPTFLCVIVVPPAIVAACVAAGIPIKESFDWGQA